MIRSNSEIDKEGMRILKAALTSCGWTYEDVEGRPGYDLWVRAPEAERKRAEVKSGRKDGWPHIDIRKALKARWNNGSEKDDPLLSELGPRPTVEVTFDLQALTFDEVFVVTRVGSPQPNIYHFTREEITGLPRTRLSYKGFLNFRLGAQEQRAPYRWPKA
jgi:hypothetical protein